MKYLDIISIINEIHTDMTIQPLLPDFLFFLFLLSAFTGAAEFYAFYIGRRKKAMSGIAIGAVAIALFGYATLFRLT